MDAPTLACAPLHAAPLKIVVNNLATGAGVLLALTPMAVAATFVLWLLVVRVTRTPSIASLASAVAAPREQLRLLVTQPPSLTNMRLVLAGWMSLNPLMFSGTGLVLSLLLAFSSFWLVRSLGRRQP